MSKLDDMPPAYAATAPNNTPGIGFNAGPYPSVSQGQWVPPPAAYAAPQFQQPPPQATITTHTLVVNPGMAMGPSLGNCPSCRIGNVQSEFSCCGICLAIFFFPIGILCCLCMMNRRCSHCGALFG